MKKKAKTKKIVTKSKKKEIKKKLKTTLKTAMKKTKKIRIKEEPKRVMKKIVSKIKEKPKTIAKRVVPKIERKLKKITKKVVAKVEKKPVKATKKVAAKIEKKLKKVTKKIIAEIEKKPKKVVRKVIAKIEKKVPIKAIKKVEVKKKKIKAKVKEKPLPTPLEILPKEYDENSITLMTVDPNKIFAFYEVKEDTLAMHAGNLNVRLYDVTGVEFDGTNANSYFDIAVSERIGSRYIDVSPEKEFIADIGIINPKGIFILIARSNKVLTPRITISEKVTLPQKLYDTGFRIGY